MAAAGQHDAKKTEQRVLRRFHKALSTFRLIEDGDKVLVGLSGGKDSLCLLELLAGRMKIQRPAFSVEAIHIRMANISYETDTAYLRDFASKFGIPLHIVDTGFELDPSGKKPVCFLCSWHRRKQMFNLAQELGCNKIALGHHLDDVVETTLMNLFFQGRFAPMPAKLSMRKMPLAIIRPLCMETESDLNRMAEMRQYEKQVKLCPYEHDSHRATVKQMVADLERIYPDAKHSVWNALMADGKMIE